MKKKYRILVGLLILFFVGTITYFDGFLYQNPIMIVKNVKTIDTINLDDDGNKQITQKISGILINRNMKHKTMTNQYTTSQMTDFEVRTGQQLILESNGKTIQTVKRDYVLAITLISIVLLLTLIVPTFLKNIGILLIYFFLYIVFIMVVNHNSLFVLPMAIIMNIVVLSIIAFMLFGKRKQTLYLLGAIVLAITLALIIGIACLKLNNFSDINFELSGAGVQPYLDVFVAQVLFGVSGVILDEAIDITASMSEIVKQDNVDRRQLYRIGMKIGKDLIGPLTGILFFIIIANHMNEITVYLSNNYPQKELFQLIISPDIAQFLISVLGIVLTVPITSYIFSRVLLRGND